MTDERFWKKVDKSGACWLWTGSLSSDGYGQVMRIALSPSPIRAHRYAWLLCFGEIQEGLCVLHKCDVRCCVNPSHLFLGTKLDNTHDMLRKKRNAHGTKHPLSKLTDAAIREIKDLAAVGAPQRLIAKRFGVCQQNISQILRGKKWRHV